MKKQLLLGAFLLGSFLTANAQDNCAGALPVTSGSTYTVTAYNGTYEESCWQEANATPFGEWYSFTATENGYLTLSSVLESNPTGVEGYIDTRLSVFTGTCDVLTCYDGSDDVDFGGQDYRTELKFVVAAGTTYYIQWDNAYQNLEFDFSVEFEAVSCFPPTSGWAFPEETPPTTTTATITWTAPALGTPTGYEIEYGLLGFTQGTGEVIEVDTEQVDFVDLQPSSNYAFYIRAICGEGNESEWSGPITFNTVFEAVEVLPYDYGFEAEGAWAPFTGWNIVTEAQVGAADDTARTGDGFAFSNTSTTAAANTSLFTRAIALEAGQTVDVSFYTAYIGVAAGGDSATLELTVGTDETDQEAIASYTLAPMTGNTMTYVERTGTWTAETEGVYFFAIRNNSPIVNDNGSILVDDFHMEEGTANTEEFASAAFSVFPNPSNSVVNVANAGNIDTINVVDINGRTVKSAKFNGAAEAQVNISDLANGVYLMTIASDKGTATKKIVKN